MAMCVVVVIALRRRERPVRRSRTLGRVDHSYGDALDVVRIFVTEVDDSPLTLSFPSWKTSAAARRTTPSSPRPPSCSRLTENRVD